MRNLLLQVIVNAGLGNVNTALPVVGTEELLTVGVRYALAVNIHCIVVESHNQRISGNLPHAVITLYKGIVLAAYIDGNCLGIGEVITECCAKVRIDLGILVTFQVCCGTCGLGYDTHLLGSSAGGQQYGCKQQ